MSGLEKYVGDEVFIACASGAYLDESLEPSEIGVFRSITELNAYICDLTPDTGEEAVACHGILMSATYIPDDCISAISHVVIQDSEDSTVGCVIDTSPIGEEEGASLVKFIENLLSGGFSEQFGTELDIENIFFVCGYPLMLSYLIQCEEIDEEKIVTIRSRTKHACDIGKEMLEK